MPIPTLGLGLTPVHVAQRAPLTMQTPSIDDIHPPTFDFITAQNNVDTINAAYEATNNHAYIIDFTIADPQTPPASNETLFYHGVNNNFRNYIWLRRLNTGDLRLIIRSSNATLLDLTFTAENLYINRLMRMGVVIRDGSNYEIYINGRQYATAMGKAEPLTNADTALFFNAGFGSDSAAPYGARLRYYDVPKTRAELEAITNVTLAELGLSYSRDSSRIAIIGQGQSNMSGKEPVANKPIMPQVATGNLQLLTTAGGLQPFTESWNDPGVNSPLFNSFAKPAYFAGYMGRVGNDVAAATGQKTMLSCAAQAGTAISTDWAGARTDLNIGAGDTTTLGALTLNLWEPIRQAYALCGQVSLVHAQGESDALNGLSQADYEMQLNAYFDYLDYYYPQLQHYVVGLNAYNVNSGADSTNWIAINAARQAVATSRANCTFIDVSDIVITNPDGLHYQNANQEIIGARIANAINA